MMKIGEKLRRLHRARISRIEAVAKMKAMMDVENGFAPTSKLDRWLPVSRKPPAKAMIERFAPNTAAFDTPKVDGLAMLLFRFVCIIRPDTERPAPAISAARTLGRRMFQMILLFAAVLRLARARKQSAMDIWDEPTNRHTKAIKMTQRRRDRVNSLFFL